MFQLTLEEWADLVQKIESLQAAQGEHHQHIAHIYKIIEELVNPAFTERKPIGFK
jgi:hypothetical protein